MAAHFEGTPVIEEKKIFYHPSTKLLLMLGLLTGLYSCANPQPITTPFVEEEESMQVQVHLPDEKVLLLRAPDPRVDLGPAMATLQKSTTEALLLSRKAALSPQPLPEDPLRYQEILDPRRNLEGSFSQGTIREGRLRNAALLPVEGAHHQIIERHRQRNTNFGTSELVNALLRAAELVAEEHQGAPLRVGNLGFRNGGPIPWSSSHEAGRDADLAFYVIDRDGNSLPSPDLISFDDQGRAIDHDLLFDIPRNWTFVRALLTDSTIHVQWLFVSEGLKELLMLHALALEEPPEIIAMAASILHQPTDAAPHDDHLHLRIGCSRRDRLEGCLDWGPRWEFYDWHEQALLARSLELQRALREGDESTRRQALQFFHRIRPPHAPEILLAAALHEESQTLQEEIFAYLVTQPPTTVAGVSLLEKHLLERKTDRFNYEERRALYRILRSVLLPEAMIVAKRLFEDQTRSPEERLLAISALDLHTEPSQIPWILEALAKEENRRLREGLSQQLYRVAARSDGIDWAIYPLREEHFLGLKQWHDWWEEHPSREAILTAMLYRLGIPKGKDIEAIDELIPYLRNASDYERYNLNLLLSQWTGRWVPREWTNGSEAQRFWTRWWTRNRDRVLNPRPAVWEQALD